MRKPPATEQAFGFLLLPRFSNMCLANAIEPLRGANEIRDRMLYRRRLVSLDGQPVTSSSGIEIKVDGPLSALGSCDALFVVASYGYRACATAKLIGALRRAARSARVVGGLDTGSWLLAKAGLLNGYTATIHWQELDRLTEDFPETTCSAERYVIDRDRITSGGATTVLDLMLRLIRERHGDALALDVMRLFLYDAERAAEGPQRGAVHAPFVARAPLVVKAINLMEAALETPLPLPEIAEQLGCSERQLDRMFVAALGIPPQRYYRSLRLAAARRLLQETPLSVAEVAERSGFSSPAVFSRAYAAHFGQSPRDTRKARATAVVVPRA